jgi:hypothetical protein
MSIVLWFLSLTVLAKINKREAEKYSKSEEHTH